MIGWRDYLSTLLRLASNRIARLFLLEVRKTVRVSLLPKRIVLLSLKESSGAEIKTAYRLPEYIPQRVRSLDDRECYVSIILLAKNQESVSGYLSIEGVLNRDGRVMFIGCGAAYI
jgi:hypothetical protein